MIEIPSLEFFADWITLIQSFLFFFEKCSNFLKQNIGFCKLCLQDWLICAQIFKSSTSRFQKIFSARCWSPGLVMIFSILCELMLLLCNAALLVIRNLFAYIVILWAYRQFFLRSGVLDFCLSTETTWWFSIKSPLSTWFFKQKL